MRGHTRRLLYIPTSCCSRAASRGPAEAAIWRAQCAACMTVRQQPRISLRSYQSWTDTAAIAQDARRRQQSEGCICLGAAGGKSIALSVNSCHHQTDHTHTSPQSSPFHATHHADHEDIRPGTGPLHAHSGPCPDRSCVAADRGSYQVSASYSTSIVMAGSDVLISSHILSRMLGNCA